MPNFEHHLIVGHVGGDVTLRYTQSGVAVASFSLAVNDRRNKDAPPTWYRVTCWRQLAEFANEYVRKGGKAEETVGRKCLCNGLVANIGLGQRRADGYEEPPLLTAGNDLACLKPFISAGRLSYHARDVVESLVSHA